MSYLPGKFVWFEHMSGDIPKARAFYDALFNWNTEAMKMSGQTYYMIHNGHDGIGGYRSAPAGASSQWVSYLSVLDVDATFATAIKAGAKSQMPPTNFGDVGRGASITDPTGAPFSIWKTTAGDRADVPKAPAGDWAWNELWTPDERTALAFYEKVFGYTHDKMEFGVQGTYYVLKMAGVPRAGLMRSVQRRAPAMWLPYVEVDDCDASVSQAQALGAKVLTGASDIPKVGRFAILADPLGAAIAIIRSDSGTA